MSTLLWSTLRTPERHTCGLRRPGGQEDTVLVPGVQAGPGPDPPGPALRGPGPGLLGSTRTTTDTAPGDRAPGAGPPDPPDPVPVLLTWYRPSGPGPQRPSEQQVGSDPGPPPGVPGPNRTQDPTREGGGRPGRTPERPSTLDPGPRTQYPGPRTRGLGAEPVSLAC